MDKVAIVAFGVVVGVALIVYESWYSSRQRYPFSIVYIFLKEMVHSSIYVDIKVKGSK
jgi:hypothetical protein